MTLDLLVWAIAFVNALIMYKIKKESIWILLIDVKEFGYIRYN